MNPHLKSPFARLRAASAALFLCLACLSAKAANAYTGVYFGTYTSLSEHGSLAFFVGGDGWGAMVSYASNGEGGSVTEGFTVSSSGNFNFSIGSGTQAMGAITGSTLAGSYFGTDGSGSFTATLKSATGTHQASAGYYSGSANNGGTAVGTLKLILAADGSFRGTQQDLPDDGEVDDGYLATLNSQNQFSLVSVSSTTVSGSLAPATTSFSGTWQNSSGTGPITLARTRALETSACSYALGSSGANVSAQYGDGSFTVTTAAGCAWTAQTAQSWLHTSSSGSGHGTVSYYADANLTAAFRTGTITVGGQSFAVSQGPAGFVWHHAFGWLFDAGGGWRHADGFGWMWFSPGEWLWTSSLQGWLAITDPNSRTLWSTQFRWLTPSASDPYKADTTAIGPIYVARYHGSAIPDGWVVSDRFGYVWANGDGQWFYSDQYGWLGVTPEGGIWSVNLGRFL